MSAVLKPDVSNRRAVLSNPKAGSIPADLFAGSRSSRSRHSVEASRRVVQQPITPSELRPKIRRLPAPRPTPFWLKFLISLQRGSTVVTWGLVAGVLALYGWTVYSQQAWSRVYQKLDRLQRSEQQMMAANGLLQEHMAEQAETGGAGLIPAKPSINIFLERAPQRPVPSAPTEAGVASDSVSELPKPLGY